MIHQGDCMEVLKTMDAQSVNCCVTSPPYWGLRDYGCDGQIGLEQTPQEFVDKMVQVFREVKRVLKDDGTLWLNLGDSYSAAGKDRTAEQAVRKTTLAGGTSTQQAGLKQISKIVGDLKPKDLCGIPWRVAFALQADGWYLRSDIIWSKPNPMPESVTDRPTKAHEYIFLMSKSSSYYYDNDAIRESMSQSSIERLSQDIENQNGSDRAHAGGKSNGKMKAVGGSFHDHDDDLGQGQRIGYKGVDTYHPLGRNKRTVWEISTHGFSEAHFATFPPNLIKPCILAGCPRGGTVLDPFFGAGTTGLVALQNAREFVGIELNPEYIKIAEKRLRLEDTTPTMFDPGAA